MDGHSAANHAVLQHWKAHPTIPGVFFNSLTKKSGKRNIQVFQEYQEQFILKRMNDCHSYYNKIEHYRILEDGSKYRAKAKMIQYEIFTDGIFPILQEHWIPVDSAITIIKGFRRLCNRYGLFRICEQMISMNEQYEIKVWINPNPTQYKTWKKAQSEQIMLADITQIIMRYDPETGSEMIGCLTLNEAMNKILMHLPKNRIQNHLSSRTIAQDFHNYSNLNTCETKSKNIFRETRETEDENSKITRDADNEREELRLSNLSNAKPSNCPSHLVKIPTLEKSKRTKSPGENLLIYKSVDSSNKKIEPSKMMENRSLFCSGSKKNLDLKLSQKDPLFHSQINHNSSLQNLKKDKKMNEVQNFGQNSVYLTQSQVKIQIEKERKSCINNHELPQIEEERRASNLRYLISDENNKLTESKSLRGFNFRFQLPFHHKNLHKNRSGEFITEKSKEHVRNNIQILHQEHETVIFQWNNEKRKLKDKNKETFPQLLMPKSHPTENENNSCELSERREKQQSRKKQKRISESPLESNLNTEKKESKFQEKREHKKIFANRLREQFGGILQIPIANDKKVESEQIRSCQPDSAIKRKAEEKRKNFASLKNQAFKLLNN